LCILLDHGVPMAMVSPVIAPPPRLPGVSENILSYLSKIKILDGMHEKIELAYCYWSLGQLDEALLLLEEVPRPLYVGPDVLCAAIMLAGIKFELLESYPPEIADQLLGETEALLSELASASTKDLNLNEPMQQALGRLYLRLAQVRERIGMSTRDVGG